MVPGEEETRPEGREPEKKIYKKYQTNIFFIWVRGAPRTPGDPIGPKKSKKTEKKEKIEKTKDNQGKPRKTKGNRAQIEPNRTYPKQTEPCPGLHDAACPGLRPGHAAW